MKAIRRKEGTGKRERWRKGEKGRRREERSEGRGGKQVGVCHS